MKSRGSMRTGDLPERLALLVLSVTSATACSGRCPGTVVDRTTTVLLGSGDACAAVRASTPSNGTVPVPTCVTLCKDAAVNVCSLPYDYWGTAASDGGCPAIPDGGTTVVLTCEVTHTAASDSFCKGRRPLGLVPFVRGRTEVLGDYFAECAHLEAASVLAFDTLVTELVAHGASLELVSRARRARRDEVRHARLVGRLAARFNGRPKKPRVVRGPVRQLVDVAIENATEGVVRETFGALMALFQAEHAEGADVRSILRDIARDECGHAELSMHVAEWARGLLTRRERDRVDEAAGAAMAELRAAVAREPHPDLVRVAGLPCARIAAALVDTMRREILAA